MRCAQSHNICYNFKSFTLTRPNLGTLHASHPSFAATASALPRANDVLIHDTDKNKLHQSPRGQAINYDFVVREQLSILRCCYTDNHAALAPERHLLAVQAAVELKHLVSHVVDTKASGLKSLQSAIISSGAVTFLLKLAKSGEPSAFEALQMLCYRNAIACEQMVTEGAVDIIAADLSTANTALQNAMCYLLTGLVAFSFKTHTSVAASGLVPHLVGLCRNQSGLGCELDDDHRKLSGRAASVLRNLAHNTEQHTLLEQSGAIEALVGIMRNSQQDSASSINAAVAVACLVGHEEDSTRLQLDKDLVGKILEVLNAACQGVMCYGMFWTVWKLCQGLTNLTVNDKNKMLVTAMGGIPVLSEVLLGHHHNNEAAQRYALSALWNLAFHEASRKEILQTPGLVDAIRSCLAMSENPKTKEVAKGALWTLGLEQDLKTLTEHNAPHLEAGTLHVMLSYEWSCQPSVLLIKSELEKAGYKASSFLNHGRRCRPK
ncbi:hypothetical protein CEUSTIGMA_g3744.t1 [Chlamydomonas eustigma]|uniref:Armadillo repeat-containing domain-containing protein n=1 Tax=Chlamydomonas eustigma TaxID=1157962 RepID=A0A250X025_9CHLO|nr:hypothetical protein CEUSTIGMA_g3744.t1 [Chlamydomonas eustigma]|eukprot:GAX76299.1 hypothetical protein CEUSTIGMA_g3744.t1 [Chlamydomonas eustigma]